MKTKTCNTCHVPKPLSDFRKNFKYSDGREGRCKECLSERTAELKEQKVVGKISSIQIAKCFKMPISEVYNECNMIGMARYPDKFFDLAIVDPPYGINAPNMNMGSNPNRSRNDGYGSGPAISTAQKIKGRLNQGSGKLKNRALNTMNCDWDYEKPSPEYFKELFRVSKQQIIWGGNYFDLPPTRGIICWDKLQPWENFSQWEMAWTSFDKPAAIFKFSNTGGANQEENIHPTQKPVPLYKWVLHKYAQPGNKIIDTHMGSQSSRIAAYQMGFDYYGWEIDREYYEAGNKRFKEQTAQLKLL